MEIDIDMGTPKPSSLLPTSQYFKGLAAKLTQEHEFLRLMIYILHTP